MVPTILPHFTSLQDALAELFGENVEVMQSRRIAGGDINDAYGLHLSNGTHLFMKSNAKQKESFFTAEAMGVYAIAQTGTIRTPHLLCSGTDSRRGGSSFLLMEFIESGHRVTDYWERFACQLAALHQASTEDLVPGGTYGFIQDNFIGARQQVNTPYDYWISFFRECRLAPQFSDAASYFTETERKRIIRLLDHLEDVLVEPDHPSLLHGDLWAGNVITGNDGKAWLIDPAVYVGHPEADLAMTELFGGFPPAFYAAYHEVFPLQDGYEDRRDLYNLYQLLNHLNLFGGAYLSSVRRIVEKYTKSIKTC